MHVLGQCVCVGGGGGDLCHLVLSPVAIYFSGVMR